MLYFAIRLTIIVFILVVSVFFLREFFHSRALNLYSRALNVYSRTLNGLTRTLNVHTRALNIKFPSEKRQQLFGKKSVSVRFFSNKIRTFAPETYIVRYHLTGRDAG